MLFRSITVKINGSNFSYNTQKITHSLIEVAGNFTFCYNQYVLNGLVVNYEDNPSSLLTFYSVPSAGNYTFSAYASNNFPALLSLLVTELKR